LVAAGLSSSIGEILPNPIAVPETAVQPTTREGLNVGFVGSPSRRKGLHILVDVIEGLRDEPFSWLVFGIDPSTDSPYVRSCERSLKEKGLAGLVHWEGRTKDVDSAYRRMDVLVVPSLKESWCRVAMEGMAIGLPVVGTDIPGMRELFAEVPGALTFPIDEPQTGQQQLLELRNVELRRELSDRGREAMRAFEVTAIRDQLLRLYVQVVDAGSAGSQALAGR